MIPNHATEKPIIVAWSLGGLFAIKFCAAHPNLCKKLILVNCLPKFVSDDTWQAIPTHIAREFAQLCRANMHHALEKFTRLVKHPTHTHAIEQHLLFENKYHASLKRQLQFLFAADYRSLLKKLNIPISCYFGTHDTIIPIQAAQQLKTINPNITLKIIQKAGHIPFLSHTNDFITHLKDDLHE